MASFRSDRERKRRKGQQRRFEGVEAPQRSTARNPSWVEPNQVVTRSHLVGEQERPGPCEEIDPRPAGATWIQEDRPELACGVTGAKPGNLDLDLRAPRAVVVKGHPDPPAFEARQLRIDAIAPIDSRPCGHRIRRVRFDRRSTGYGDGRGKHHGHGQ